MVVRMTMSKVTEKTRVTTTPKELQPHRDRILAAASAAFLELGFEQSSTAHIAREAKVSKRELYRLFRDKRALLSAVVVDLQAGMQSRIVPEWFSGGDPATVLPRVGAAILDFILSERFGKLLRIVATESYQSPEIAEQFYALGPQRGMRGTAEYMKIQMKRGKLRKADPMQAARDFLDLIVSANRMTAVILGQVAPETRRRAHVRHAVEVFLCVYGADGHEPPSWCNASCKS